MKMKKYFLLALVVLTGMASSCKYDDGEIWDNVNNLADRVASLEAITKQMNSDIAAMQSVITALQNQTMVKEVEELKDGYIIHFTDGTQATIKNGTDGKDGADGENGKDAPVVNVAQVEGVYYWTITIDGKTEWLTDEEGNKLAVTGADGAAGSNGSAGADGKDGKTPLIRVNKDYWEVSYDGGKTYVQITTPDGEPVKAVGEKGKDGDSMFSSVEEVNGNLVITMANKEVYTLCLAASVTYKNGDTPLEGNEVSVAVGESVTLAYQVEVMENYSAEIISQKGVEATVDEKAKSITIALNEGVTEGKIVILYYNANQTITSSLIVKSAQ